MPYFRFCKKCGESFHPVGKYSKFCDKCKRGNFLVAIERFWKGKTKKKKVKKK